MKRSVSVRIDDLVLHGVRPSDRHRVAAAVSVELERLLAERGVPVLLQKEIGIDRLAPSPAHMPRRQSPRLLGERVAGALYRSLERSR